MTKDNQRKNVAAEVARGEESRRAAAVLLAAGLAADAVRRAYYAALHYARAVLTWRATRRESSPTMSTAVGWFATTTAC